MEAIETSTQPTEEWPASRDVRAKLLFAVLFGGLEPEINSRRRHARWRGSRFGLLNIAKGP